MRLFLGIELPEPLVEEVGRVQSLLRQSRADVRWVQPSGAHLTLKFLGEVDPGRRSELDEAIAPAVAASAPHRVELVGVGAFPSETQPRVVWVGVEDMVHALQALQSAIEGAVHPLGFRRERRRFTPHVTIGRVRRPSRLRALSTAIRQLRHEPLGGIDIAEVVLFESKLTPAGARYRARARYRLSDRS